MISSDSQLHDLSRATVALEVRYDDGNASFRLDLLDENEIGQPYRGTEIWDEIINAPVKSAVGTGLLLDIEGTMYVITAGHVLEELQKPSTFSRLNICPRTDDYLGKGDGRIRFAWSLSSPHVKVRYEPNNVARIHDVGVVRLPRLIAEDLRLAGYRAFADADLQGTPAAGDSVVSVHFPLITRDSGAEDEFRQAEGKFFPTPPLQERQPRNLMESATSFGTLVEVAPDSMIGAVAAMNVGPGSSGAPVMTVKDGAVIGLVVGTLAERNSDNAEHANAQIVLIQDVLNLLGTPRKS